MNIEWNISVVLAHSVMYFARESAGGTWGVLKACSPEIPTPQDPAISYINGMVEELKQFPLMRKVMAAAQTGEKVEVDGTTYDFTGKGDADYQRKFADQMGQALLDNQKKYGSDIIKQRLTELERSDPEGFKARKDLYSRIIGSIQSGAPDYEAAMQLEGEVLADLERGAQLGPRRLKEVQEGVRGHQVARGGGYGTADTFQEAGVVEMAGRQQLNSAQQMALDFLRSGVSKEDKENRFNQQGMANLGAFLSGETPTAQFGQLSGAQNGAAPFFMGQPIPGVNMNAGVQGMQNQFSAYLADANYASQQISPAFAGLGMGLQGAAAATAWMPQNNAPNPWTINTQATNGSDGYAWGVTGSKKF